MVIVNVVLRFIGMRSQADTSRMFREIGEGAPHKGRNEHPHAGIIHQDRNLTASIVQHNAITAPQGEKHHLASTIQDKEWDGRFSRSNKEWASSVQLPDTAAESGFDRRHDYSVDTHPAVLDGFVSMFRKEIDEREKTSILSSLHSQQTKTERSIKPKEQEAYL